MALMYDIGPRLGYAPKKVRVGFGYQFWNNKFGNSRRTTGGQGSGPARRWSGRTFISDGLGAKVEQTWRCRS